MSGARQSLRVVPSESFGSRLRAQRLADDFTQAELGERFGVKQQTIGAWEHDERPQSRFFGPLAEYLGLEEQELARLIDGEPDQTIDQEPATGAVPDKPADTDGAAMRQLAWSFVLDQRSRPLPPEQAAEVYKDITAFFKSRAIEKLCRETVIPSRRQGPCAQQVEAAARLYGDQGWSLSRIGHYQGVAASTVWRALSVRGVGMRVTHSRSRLT